MMQQKQWGPKWVVISPSVGQETGQWAVLYCTLYSTEHCKVLYSVQYSTLNSAQYTGMVCTVLYTALFSPYITALFANGQQIRVNRWLQQISTSVQTSGYNLLSTTCCSIQMNGIYLGIFLN